MEKTDERRIRSLRHSTEIYIKIFSRGPNDFKKWSDYVFGGEIDHRVARIVIWKILQERKDGRETD